MFNFKRKHFSLNFFLKILFYFCVTLFVCNHHHFLLVSGTVLAGVTIQSAPFLTTQNNVFQGYCVDLLNEIKLRTGINYSLYLVADGFYGPGSRGGRLSGMIADVAEKKADFAIADMTVTPQREEYVNFTEPFFTFSFAALVRKEYAKNIKTVDDLAIKSNLTIGTFMGSYIQLTKLRTARTPRWLLNQIEKYPSNLLTSEREAMLRIRKEPFALIQEEPKSTYKATQDCSLKVLKDPNYYITGKYAIAFRKDSPYIKVFNRAIAQMQSKGILEHLKRKHFNVGCLRNGANGDHTNTVVVLFATLFTLIFTIRM